jgi:hypothetical protein
LLLFAIRDSRLANCYLLFAVCCVLFAVCCLLFDICKIKPAYTAEDTAMERQPMLVQSQYQFERYKLRFDSFILDTFCGQLRSTLECATCGHQSVTFDAFCDLSIPIPKSAAKNSGYHSRSGGGGAGDTTLPRVANTVSVVSVPV